MQTGNRIRRVSVLRVSVLSLALSVMWAGSASALTDQEKCQAAKLGASGRHAQCVLRAQSTAVRQGKVADFTQCNTQVERAFANAGMSCTGTAAEIIAKNTANADGVADSIGGVFVDNLDGTITNVVDGCLWEKKTDDGSVHDVDNTYTWNGD